MAKATTKAATAAKTAAEKPAKSPELKMRMKVGRTIGRGVWLTGYKAENPDATKEQRKAAWIEARKDFTKIGLNALKTLEKSGFHVAEKPAS